MVRIVDVAKMANVSTATVSRVISNSATVKKETADKVLKAIEQLNYQPNVLARQLRKLETKAILVILPDITNTFFSEILIGIDSVGIKHGYQVLLGNTGNSGERETRFWDLLQQKQADGVILLTAQVEGKTVEDISNNYPVVLACEYIEGSQIPTVSIDNISSARKATQHLIELGHKRIGFLSGPLNGVLSRDRLKGFQQAMAQNCLPIDSFLIQEGDYSYESGYNLMLKFMAFSQPPTAVFAANDEMAIGAIKAVKSQGLKVPSDFSVIGFDDIKFASIFEPALTTISQPKFEIGKTAMELMIRLINKEDLKKKQFMLEDRLVIRESCGSK